MANNIYIGARYVPLFVGDWNDQTVYEPLSVVNYNNGTYTSKKTVPAGILPTNTEYWALTGNYNAQVEAYRQEVVALGENVDGFQSDLDAVEGNVSGLQTTVGALNDDVDALDDRVTALEDPTLSDYYIAKLSGKKMVIIGDSLVLAGSANSLGYYLREKYGMNVAEYGISGAPIAGTGSSSVYSRIDSVIADNIDVDYFVISGGANDKNDNIPLGRYADSAGGASTFTGALKTIIKKCVTAYPKKMVLGCTTFHRYNTINGLKLNERDYVNTMIETCGYFGIPCFNAYDNAGFNLIDDDGYPWADVGLDGGGTATHHISSAGYEILADKFAAFLVNSSFNIDRTSSLTYEGDYTLSNGTARIFTRTFADGFREVYCRFTPTDRFHCSEAVGGWYASPEYDLNVFEHNYFSFALGAVATPHGNGTLMVVGTGYTAVNGLGKYKVLSPTSGNINGHLTVWAYGYT